MVVKSAARLKNLAPDTITSPTRWRCGLCGPGDLLERGPDPTSWPT
jgi:hypothetical protein